MRKQKAANCLIHNVAIRYFLKVNLILKVYLFQIQTSQTAGQQSQTNPQSHLECNTNIRITSIRGRAEIVVQNESEELF